MANFKRFPGGACPQTPLACSHLIKRTHWLYQSKIAGAGPVLVDRNDFLAKYHHELRLKWEPLADMPEPMMCPRSVAVDKAVM